MHCIFELFDLLGAPLPFDCPSVQLGDGDKCKGSAFPPDEGTKRRGVDTLLEQKACHVGVDEHRLHHGCSSSPCRQRTTTCSKPSSTSSSGHPPRRSSSPWTRSTP